jgi:uncharacterized pyridoxal phosphate-dependent enzyme
MTMRARHRLTDVINARGTFTPLGVSRSSPAVRAAVAEALAGYFVMDELHRIADAELAHASGAEAGAVVHCAAAGITLAIAACMTGTSAELVAQLPDTAGMPRRVVLPAGHAVDYGQPMLQAIRLAGAVPVLAGSDQHCSAGDIAEALAHPETCCLLLVSSRLTRGASVDLHAAVATARARGVPALIDGAAQDMRMRQLIETGADAIIVSAQKYLAAPTAGLVIGRKGIVDAVRAQERGIGRAMKATKEGIFGVLAALEERQRWDETAWRDEQARKVDGFVAAAGTLPGVAARAVADPTGLPFSRAHLAIGPREGMTAASLAASLRAGSPAIWVMDQSSRDGEIALELVALKDAEIVCILARLAELLVDTTR